MLKIILALLILFLLPIRAFAQSNPDSQFITIVNPVRISSNIKNPAASLLAQYSQIKKNNLPATWLITFDALDNPELIKILKDMDEMQEMGIFLEVNPKFAQASAVVYNKSDSWHRPNSLFLSGYTQADRRKLIDTVFDKFKSQFGLYPSSVGAWWVDSYSLGYMKDRYNITANLDVADQFSTDNYSIWGQYWSVPFYPSKLHGGIPAVNNQTKLDLVTMQWAARDPLNGYGDSQASMYSTQDYSSIGLPDDYYEKLINLFAKRHNNKFGQITVGLEADLSPQSYQGGYSKQMMSLSKLKSGGEFQITTMAEFSDWYRQTFPDISPSHLLEADDLLGKRIKSFWYQTTSYRIGLTYDEQTKMIKIIDLRIYPENFQEPFYLSPNYQTTLYINIPSLIDSASYPEGYWEFSVGKLAKVNSNSFSFDDGSSIVFSLNSIALKNIKTAMPLFMKESAHLKTTVDPNKIEMQINNQWPQDKDGIIFRSLPPQVLYLINSNNLLKPVNKPRVIVSLFIVTLALAVVYKFRLYKNRQFRILVFVLAILSASVLIYKSKEYYISQSEIDALEHLKILPPGKILVYDHDCLKCSYQTRMPAAFVNLKDYVGILSNKPLIYNRSIFETTAENLSKNLLVNSGAKYIYLIKNENYIEELPFHYSSYNIKKIYENAHAQIWTVKDNGP